MVHRHILIYIKESLRIEIIFLSDDAVFGEFLYLYGVKAELDIGNRLLVEQCIQGNKDALQLFYVRFAPRMLALIKRYVGNCEEAEDILHDGFILAFTHLSELRNADHPEHWLATIMKNIALQFLKNQDVTTILSEVPDVEDTPEMDDILDFDTLESLIRKLPPGYQKVFRLAVLENKSHKEIASILGIAPNSSSSQLFHAKMMMRKLVAEYRKQAGLYSFVLLAVTIAVWVLIRYEAGNMQEATPAFHLSKSTTGRFKKAAMAQTRYIQLWHPTLQILRYPYLRLPIPIQKTRKKNILQPNFRLNQMKLN